MSVFKGETCHPCFSFSCWSLCKLRKGLSPSKMLSKGHRSPALSCGQPWNVGWWKILKQMDQTHESLWLCIAKMGSFFLISCPITFLIEIKLLTFSSCVNGFFLLFLEIFSVCLKKSRLFFLQLLNCFSSSYSSSQEVQNSRLELFLLIVTHLLKNKTKWWGRGEVFLPCVHLEKHCVIWN